MMLVRPCAGGPSAGCAGIVRFDPIDTPDYFGATRVTEDGAKALPTTV